jgi:hypothetical protein
MKEGPGGLISEITSKEEDIAIKLGRVVWILKAESLSYHNGCKVFSHLENLGMTRVHFSIRRILHGIIKLAKKCQ